MTTIKRILAVAALAALTLGFSQTADAQVRPQLLAFQSSQTVSPVTAMADGSTTFNFGPILGFDFSPDAFTIGAFLIAHGLVPSIEALHFMADAAYGIGTQDVGNNIDYNTLRVAVTAMYMVALATTSINLLPLAGLTYYRYSVSESISGFGFSASYTDIALVLGAAIVYGDFLVRAIIGLGGSADFGIAVAYLLGNGVFPSAM